MESTYLIHSQKGTSWTNHKYIKKVGNRYIYADDKISKSDLNTAVNDTMAGKNGTGSDMKKKLGSNYGVVAKTISSKFKKPSGKSSSSKSSSKSSTKKDGSSSSSKSSSGSKASSSAKSSSSSTKTATSSAKTTSAASKSSTSTATTTTTGAPSASTIPPLKTAITNVAKIGDNDSYIATQNEDGSTTVEIIYEDGSTQTIQLDNRYQVLKVGEKIEPEKKEDEEDDKEVKHSQVDRINSMYYGVNIIRRS